MTFEEHIKKEHCLWHYLYFIVHIKTKESTEFTGPESYVSDMISVSWDQHTFACMTCILYTHVHILVHSAGHMSIQAIVAHSSVMS